MKVDLSSGPLARYQTDVEKLISTGIKLEFSLLHEFEPSLVRKQLPEGEIKSLPNFRIEYQAWYSEALVCISVLLPSRLDDFRNHYEIPKNRKTLDVTNYRILDALNGLGKPNDRFGKGAFGPSAAIPHFQQQVAIVTGLRARLSSSLFDTRSILQADLFDGEIDVARALLGKGFSRAAGVIAGVVLEGHLRQVCLNHDVAVSARSSIAAVNDKLKDAEIIDQAQWRLIQLLGDLRKVCDRRVAQDPCEPSVAQIADLIDGEAKTIKTTL